MAVADKDRDSGSYSDEEKDKERPMVKRVKPTVFVEREKGMVRERDRRKSER